MATLEGEEYYQRWLRGDITCKMVREPSGCGMLAQFFGRKTEEEEEQKMLQEALRMEAQMTQQESQGSGHTEHGGDGPGETMGSERGTSADDQGHGGVLPSHNIGTSVMAPSTWPSYTLRSEPTATISLESQESEAGRGPETRALADIPAEEFSIAPEANQAELAFAIAAGDVVEGNAAMVEGAAECAASAADMNAVENPEHILDHEGGRPRSDNGTTTSTEGKVQTNLRSWLA